MSSSRVHLCVDPTDSLRTAPRMGGGFCVLIGPPGSSDSLSFSSAAAAENFARLLTLASITHGDLGKALAATAPDEHAGNVVRLQPATPPSNNPPPSAA
jgi:hypothetical protein